MISTRIETKEAFRIIGFKATLSEDGAVHDPAYSPLKTAFSKARWRTGGEYLVLSGQGGLSRLAFDRLEDEAFDAILNDNYEYVYTGHPIAEVLTNGNPMDAEVEVWVPVKKR